jgi:hypothetical protein
MTPEADHRAAPDAEAGAAPLRLWLQDEAQGAGRMCVFHAPFRLGFGDECDIRLEGEEGPDVLFEVEQARGPLLVARAVAPSEYESYVDLTLDGKPLRDTRRGLAPGSRRARASRSSTSTAASATRWWSHRARRRCARATWRC